MNLSIIVPIYGVEKYILEFAQSLLYQLNDNVELILVDDGSKDKSVDIIKSYINYNFSHLNNIVWLNQENQGQSVARNYGISVAKGQYITFLDPDDYVSAKYIKEILNAIFSDSPDIIHFNATSFKNTNEVLQELKFVENDIFYNLSNVERLKICQKNFWFSWLRVIKKEFIENDFFPVGVNYQDMIAFPQLYKKIKNVKNIKSCLVNYRIHNESSVHLFKPKLLNSIDFGIKEYQKYRDIEDIEITKKFIENRLMLTIQNKKISEAYKWYLNNIYLEENNYFYLNNMFFLKFFTYCTLYSYLKMVYKKIKRF